MWYKLKSGFKDTENRVLLSNFFSLSVLQVASHLFPLITFPYLVRVLGVELFGVLAVATAVIAYFQILTDYGFDLSATKEVSIYRDDSVKIVEIFSSIMIIKSMLVVLSLIILTVLVFSIERFSQNWEVYYFTFGVVIGQVLFPIWFFQGMEKMKYITMLTITSKFIFTLSIFIFVQEQNDFIWVPLLNATGAITAGLISLYIIKKNFKVKFVWQSASTIKHYFQGGWDIFVQRFYVNLYGSTSVIILGLLTNNMVVGYYAIAEKIVGIFSEFFSVVSTVYYPYFAKKFVANPKKSLTNLKKVSLVMLGLSITATILLLFLDDFVVKMVSGEQYNERITQTLEILTYGIILFPFFSLYTTVLVAIDQARALNIVARDSALLSLILAPILIILFQEKGLAYLMVLLWFIIIFRYVKVILHVNRSLVQSN